MLIKLGLNLLLCMQIFAEIDNKNNNKIIELKNPDFPILSLRRVDVLQWIYEAKNTDSTIIINCDEIKMTQNGPWSEECTETYLSITEGDSEVKICGADKSGYRYESISSKVIIKLVSNDGTAHVNCQAHIAKSVSNLNIINLNENNPEQILKLPENVMGNSIQEWIIKTNPESKIILGCQMEFGNGEENCNKNILTIADDGDITDYCKSEEVRFISKRNSANVRLQLADTENQRFICNVHTELIPPIVIEDSSEYGMTAGVKNATCDCGRANKARARIIKGTEARENEFPWMVLIKAYYSEDNLMSFCGGSVLTERHILTAGHCVYNFGNKKFPKAEDVTVTLREHDKFKDNGRVEVVGQALYVHDGYKQNETHDIAIIFTTKYIHFDRFVSPICITSVKLPVVHQQVLILGWGQLIKGQPTYTDSNVLMKSKVRVLETCDEPEWSICSTSFPNSVCYGDSGGPQVWLDPETNRYTQIGVAAKTLEGCGGRMNIFSDVVYFYDWIQNVIRESLPSQMTCEKVR